MNGYVNALAVSGSTLYAGGAFTTAGTNVSAYAALANLPGSLAIVTTNGAFGFTNGVFGFDVTGQPGASVVIQAGADLQTWIPLQTNLLGGGLLYFSDPQSTTNSQRFYRLVADNPTAVATAVTIAVTGYNRDVVVERTVTGTNTTPYAMAFDASYGYAFYESGLSVVTVAGGNPTPEGLPAGGAIISAVDGKTPFQLGPCNGNNVLYMNGSSPSATLGLAVPAAYNSLIILATSANGGGSGSLVINFADHTYSRPIIFNAPDWFYNPGGALTHFGRIQLGAYSTFQTDDPSDNNPNLYSTTINLAALRLNTKPIASLTFTMPNGSGTSSATATGIFALSGFPAQ